MKEILITDSKVNISVKIKKSKHKHLKNLSLFNNLFKHHIKTLSKNRLKPKLDNIDGKKNYNKNFILEELNNKSLFLNKIYKNKKDFAKNISTKQPVKQTDYPINIPINIKLINAFKIQEKYKESFIRLGKPIHKEVIKFTQSKFLHNFKKSSLKLYSLKDNHENKIKLSINHKTKINYLKSEKEYKKNNIITEKELKNLHLNQQINQLKTEIKPEKTNHKKVFKNKNLFVKNSSQHFIQSPIQEPLDKPPKHIPKENTTFSKNLPKIQSKYLKKLEFSNLYANKRKLSEQHRKISYKDYKVYTYIDKTDTKKVFSSKLNLEGSFSLKDKPKYTKFINFIHLQAHFWQKFTQSKDNFLYFGKDDLEKDILANNSKENILKINSKNTKTDTEKGKNTFKENQKISENLNFIKKGKKTYIKKFPTLITYKKLSLKTVKLKKFVKSETKSTLSKNISKKHDQILNKVKEKHKNLEINKVNNKPKINSTDINFQVPSNFSTVSVYNVDTDVDVKETKINNNYMPKEPYNSFKSKIYFLKFEKEKQEDVQEKTLQLENPKFDEKKYTKVPADEKGQNSIKTPNVKDFSFEGKDKEKQENIEVYPNNQTTFNIRNLNFESKSYFNNNELDTKEHLEILNSKQESKIFKLNSLKKLRTNFVKEKIFTKETKGEEKLKKEDTQEEILDTKISYSRLKNIEIFNNTSNTNERQNEDIIVEDYEEFTDNVENDNLLENSKQKEPIRYVDSEKVLKNIENLKKLTLKQISLKLVSKDLVLKANLINQKLNISMLINEGIYDTFYKDIENIVKESGFEEYSIKIKTSKEDRTGKKVKEPISIRA